jgi:uncharacterized protein (TIGR02118 family)
MQMVTLFVMAKRKKGMSRAEYSHYWRNQHGPLVRSVPEFIRHVKSYVQYHIPEDTGGGQIVGGASEYDGFAKLVFDSRQAMEQAFQEPKYLEIIRPDEHKFLDWEGCVSVVTEEVPMHGS